MTAAYAHTDAPVLQVLNLSKSFGSQQVLNGIDLTVREGEVICVVGPSGCGKSTLLRCINFLEEPNGGYLFLDGEPIGILSRDQGVKRDREANINRMRARIGMVFQKFNLWPHISVLENLTKAPVVVLKRDPAQLRSRALELLDRVGLLDKQNAYPNELSGGQQQRVAIARSLMMDPRLILFDEPTSALDPELVGEVLSVMRELAQSGMTMIIVTHELRFAAQVADRVVFMDQGQIVEMGPAVQVLRHPQSERLKRFLSTLNPETDPGGFSAHPLQVTATHKEAI